MYGALENRPQTRRSTCEGHVTLPRWMLQFRDKDQSLGVMDASLTVRLSPGIAFAS